MNYWSLSTSYCTDYLSKLLSAVTWICNPSIAVEIGTQRGGTANIIGRSMQKESLLVTYDRFKEKYDASIVKDGSYSMTLLRRKLRYTL